jgi:membrane-associated phospholipid phosphatase
MLALAASYFTVTFGVMIATYFSKISVHAAGIGGPGTALLIVYGQIALPVVLIWFAVIWSRKTLQQHSLKQSIIGVLIGIVITMLTYSIFYTNWAFLSL